MEPGCTLLCACISRTRSRVSAHWHELHCIPKIFSLTQDEDECCRCTLVLTLEYCLPEQACCMQVDSTMIKDSLNAHSTWPFSELVVCVRLGYYCGYGLRTVKLRSCLFVCCCSPSLHFIKWLESQTDLSQDISLPVKAGHGLLDIHVVCLCLIFLWRKLNKDRKSVV